MKKLLIALLFIPSVLSADRVCTRNAPYYSVYHFNENFGTSVRDEMGRCHGVLTGGAWTPLSIGGIGLTFAGTSGHKIVCDATTFDGTQPVTWAISGYATDISADHQLMTKGDWSSTLLTIDFNGANFAVQANIGTLTIAGRVKKNTWYRCLVRANTSRIELWVNGVFQGNLNGGWSGTGTSDLLIGNRVQNDQNFNGILTEAVVWGYYVSDREINEDWIRWRGRRYVGSD